MSVSKKDILIQLRKDLLPLQGYTACRGNIINIGFRPIEEAFPNASFPTACIHEFITASAIDAAATNGFIAVILNRLMQSQGVCTWISASRTLFPAALERFGIDAGKIIFIDLKKEKDVVPAVEEALQCDRLTAVLGETKEISFTASRRLQLAAEQSRVTGFLLRHQPSLLNTVACVCRWRINSLPSGSLEDMPGIGFPRWHIELAKVRNGKPGSWKAELRANSLYDITENISILQQEEIRKTG